MQQVWLGVLGICDTVRSVYHVSLHNLARYAMYIISQYLLDYTCVYILYIYIYIYISFSNTGLSAHIDCLIKS